MFIDFPPVLSGSRLGNGPLQKVFNEGVQGLFLIHGIAKRKGDRFIYYFPISII